jgi:hypothetical protein
MIPYIEKVACGDLDHLVIDMRAYVYKSHMYVAIATDPPVPIM